MEAWRADPRLSDRVRLRAEIVLQAAEGATDQEIAQALSISPATVSRWRHRFVVNRLEGIQQGAPHVVGAPSARLPNETRIVETTQLVAPPEGTRWTTRSLARFLGVNHMQVHRAWKTHDLRGGWGAASDRLDPPVAWVDVVGFFRCPPLRAIVFASRLPARVSRRRGGAGSKETANDADSSDVILVPFPGADELRWTLRSLRERMSDRASPRCRPEDLPTFLRRLERSAGDSVRFHVIVQHPDRMTLLRLRAWVDHRPYFEIETVDRDEAWDHAVDAWFGAWSRRRVAPTSFRGVASLTEAALRFLGRPAHGATTFVWTSPRGSRPKSAADGGVRAG